MLFFREGTGMNRLPLSGGPFAPLVGANVSQCGEVVYTCRNSPHPGRVHASGALPATPLFQSPARPTFAVYALPANPTITLITPTVTFYDAITLRDMNSCPSARRTLSFVDLLAG
ncbi:MAG: hypothetical protein IPL78_26300 [Chloroflexi bacterium]|nr:hypothetical protein [Chloroflexota bacterium]